MRKFAGKAVQVALAAGMTAVVLTVAVPLMIVYAKCAGGGNIKS